MNGTFSCGHKSYTFKVIKLLAKFGSIQIILLDIYLYLTDAFEFS